MTVQDGVYVAEIAHTVLHRTKTEHPQTLITVEFVIIKDLSQRERGHVGALVYKDFDAVRRDFRLLVEAARFGEQEDWFAIHERLPGRHLMLTTRIASSLAVREYVRITDTSPFTDDLGFATASLRDAVLRGAPKATRQHLLGHVELAARALAEST